MNTTEAARRMLDGGVGKWQTWSYRWHFTHFEKKKPAGNWERCRALPDVPNWQIRCDPAPQETERWVRIEHGDKLIFECPTAAMRLSLSVVSDNYGTRLVGYEFEGYEGTHPLPQMWDRLEAPHRLSIFAPYPLDTSRLRVASAVILTKEA